MYRGNCLIFFLLEYYRGITGVLCVISLQFIGFSLNKHSIEITLTLQPSKKFFI